MTNVNAVIYARFSSDRQREESIEEIGRASCREGVWHCVLL